MKRLIAALLLAVCMMALAVSCTREPTKIDRNGTGESTTVPASDDTKTGDNDGKINNGGANTEDGWGALIPVG